MTSGRSALSFTRCGEGWWRWGCSRVGRRLESLDLAAVRRMGILISVFLPFYSFEWMRGNAERKTGVWGRSPQRKEHWKCDG